MFYAIMIDEQSVLISERVLSVKFPDGTSLEVARLTRHITGGGSTNPTNDVLVIILRPQLRSGGLILILIVFCIYFNITLTQLFLMFSVRGSVILKSNTN